MRVRDVMTSPPITVTPRTAAKEAIELLDRHHFNAIPVVDETGELVGILTEGDLLRPELWQEPLHQARIEPPAPLVSQVEDLMTTDVASVPPTLELPVLARLMLDDHLKSVPVVDNGRVVGMVTRRDLIGTFIRSDADLESDVRWLLDREKVALGPLTAEVHAGVVTAAGITHCTSDALIRRVIRDVVGVVDVDTSAVIREPLQARN